VTDRAVPTFRFEEGVCIAQAEPPPALPVELDSPAASVMTDLTQVRAATVHPDTPLAQAEQTMIQRGVRLLFVVSQLPCVDGIVGAVDLHGERPMQVLHRRGGAYGDLRVADVMTRLPDIDVVDHSALADASVARVVATLRRHGRPHLLVVERATASAPPRIRGLFSATQVERQLGRPLNTVEIASTFAEIERALL
jgi:CBS domain-containing protein